MDECKPLVDGALKSGVKARRAALHSTKAGKRGASVAAASAFRAASMPIDLPKQMMWAGEMPTSAASEQAAAVQVMPGMQQVHSFVDPSPWQGLVNGRPPSHPSHVPTFTV